VALLAGLTACGGGGSDSPSPAVGAPSPGAPPPAPAPGPSPSPSPASPPPAVPALACNLSNFYTDALARVNAFRASSRQCGATTYAAAPALVWNNKLTTASAGHSQDMVANNFFSHTSHDGRTLSNRLAEVSYTWSNIGENIAAGQVGVNAAMSAWEGSAGHCANLMNPNFTQIGLVCVMGNANTTYGTYWTMDLAKPN